MSITGLNIYSDISHQHWILKNYNNDTQDKYTCNDLVNIPSQFNHENVFYYQWNTSDSYKYKQSSTYTLYNDDDEPLFDENSIHISKILSKYMNDWLISSPSNYLSHYTNKSIGDILRLIRDSLFLRAYNKLKGSNNHGIHGFIVYSRKDDSLYDYFLKLCKNAFWLPKKPNKHNHECSSTNDSQLRFVYPIDLSDYTGLSKSNFCFTDRNYLVTCCCERCTRVLDYLSRNHDDPVSNENLKNLLINDKDSLVVFLIHSIKYQTLEFKLLKITLNGLMIKENTINEYNITPSVTQSELKNLFKSCFVLFRGFETISNYSPCVDKNGLYTCSLVMDLLDEYTQLWEELDLPIFSFMFIQIEKTVTTNQPVIHDESTQSNPQSLLSNSTHFKYSTMVYDEVINENSKVEYFKDLLTNSSKGDESKDSDLRGLLRLVRGYSLEDVKVLTRLARCESLKDQCHHFWDETVKYFEKAVSLKPMVDFSNTLGLHPELASFSSPLNFSPLKLQDGKVVYKTGLESLILPPATLDTITSFLSQELGPDALEPNKPSVSLLIKGESGVGKTTLAHCIAQEINAIFFYINILSFIRPQVGLSEKLFHSFITKIRNHFSGSTTGMRKDCVKCVILLEGLEALKGNDGYLKRFVSAIRFELDDIIFKSNFGCDYSILFITTCQKISDLPEKIRRVFPEVLELDTPQMSTQFAKQCFELFLNLRCDFNDRMDELIEHISERNYLNKLTPLKIANISRNATLQVATNPSYVSNDGFCGSRDTAKADLVNMETLISTIDSTFNHP